MKAPRATRRRSRKAPWDQRGAFRETMLVFFDEELVDRAVRPFGRLLYDLSLETHSFGDRSPGVTARELAAAAEDLRHLQGFLFAVSRNRSGDEEDAGERGLRRLAQALAREVRALADEIDRALGGITPAGGAPDSGEQPPSE